MTGRLPKKAGANAQNANALQPGNATELRTEYVPISEVRQHEQNPRNGDVELIAESVAINGVYKPIVTARDGTILAGNHSYQSFLSLGHEFVNIVRLDLDPDSAEAKRVMLADNRTSDVGNYDDAQLLQLLTSLETLEGTGFDTLAVDDLTTLLDGGGDYVAPPDITFEHSGASFRQIVLTLGLARFKYLVTHLQAIADDNTNAVLQLVAEATGEPLPPEDA